MNMSGLLELAEKESLLKSSYSVRCIVTPFQCFKLHQRSVSKESVEKNDLQKKLK